jgi:hypothetical protein
MSTSLGALLAAPSSRNVPDSDWATVVLPECGLISLLRRSRHHWLGLFGVGLIFPPGTTVYVGNVESQGDFSVGGTIQIRKHASLSLGVCHRRFFIAPESLFFPVI